MKKTLLKKKINNFEILNKNKYLLTNSFLIKQELINALLRKEILVSSLNMSNSNNNLVITINGFTRTNKLSRYKKLVSQRTVNKKKSNLSNLLTDSFNNTIKQNNVLINYININKLIDTKLALKNYKKYKKFLGVMFSRGANLYVDFIKVITLIEQNNIDPQILLLILGQIFRKLSKSKHNRFLLFIKTLFENLTKSKEKNILGIKFIINGRIMGKPRASTVKLETGSIQSHTVDANCFIKKKHVYTVYGAFGFQLSINYKK